MKRFFGTLTTAVGLGVIIALILFAGKMLSKGLEYLLSLPMETWIICGIVAVISAIAAALYGKWDDNHRADSVEEEEDDTEPEMVQEESFSRYSRHAYGRDSYGSSNRNQ